MKQIISKSVTVILILTLISSTMKAQDAPGLSQKEISMSGISATAATGRTDLLKIQLNEGLDKGLTVNEIKEALTQLYAYCGFPRSLNALDVFSKLLQERKAKGLSDVEGEKIVQNTTTDKYEQGRKTLEELSGTRQVRPAPGFGEFAPRIDAFLKEHLFADIFASKVLSFRQRELITISALASMEGVESQLLSHIGMGKNTGITDGELMDLSQVVDQLVSAKQANTLLGNLNKPLIPLH
jgi:4-carboxymuconolactone decarboxylase